MKIGWVIHILITIWIYKYLAGSFKGILIYYIVSSILMIAAIFLFFRYYLSQKSAKQVIKLITTFQTDKSAQLKFLVIVSFLPVLVATFFTNLPDMPSKILTFLPNAAVEFAVILSVIGFINVNTRLFERMDNQKF